MENSQSQIEPEEEMSFEQKISQDFNKAGHSRSHRQAFGREGGGSAFPHDRLVILSLGLLNAVLLIIAVVVGIYCAKVNNLQIPHSAATPLMIELNFLRNSSEIIKAKLEAEAALARERASQVQLKLQVRQQKTNTDILQSHIETLLTEKTKLMANKTALEGSCGRCLPKWTLLKSSCYYFSNPVSDSKKNWPDSRADCISRGGDLLVINNLLEQQLMSDNFQKVNADGLWWQNGFWIGLTDVVTEGIWVWINNVTELETMYWKLGQPRRSGVQTGNCAAHYYYDDTRRTWYNGDCQNHLFNWICEMDPS
ncbi:CD209 antigen-like protein E [Thunnus thynnus]|uniref:CD209 antigen-like protein E n=1 Tax=Thunnus thynnus TaxID=8237 RepID=UPI0035285C74|eukprot:superscaffoldBa00003053_g15982